MPKQPLVSTRYVTLWQYDNGRTSISMRNGAIIVPINSDGLSLVQTEPSNAYEGLRTITIPGGAIEPGETPAEAANRELQEEMGLKAGRVDFLGVVDILTKYIECQVHLYLGRDLVPSQRDGDEAEGWIGKHEPIDLGDIETLMTAGKLRDSVTINALLLARQFLERE